MGTILPRYKARVCFDRDRSLLAVNSGGGASEFVLVRPVLRNVLLLQVTTYSSAAKPRQIQHINCLAQHYLVHGSKQ